METGNRSIAISLRLRRCSRWIAIALTVFAGVPAAPSPQTTTADKTPGSTWLPVAIQRLLPELAKLSTDEKQEQLRDWALYGAVLSTGQKTETYRDILHAIPPLRLDMTSPLSNQRVGPNRWVALPASRMLALVPEGAAADLLRLGRMADEYRIDIGNNPAQVVIFEYRARPEEGRLEIRNASTVVGSVLFSATAGFRQSTIQSLADLEAFLAANLDLVYASRRNGEIVLAGRAHDRGTPVVMNLQDVATIFQAGANLQNRVRQILLSTGLEEPYYRHIDKQVADRIKSRLGETWQSAQEVERLREKAYLDEPYEEFAKGAVAAALVVNPASLGFSLDPRDNHGALATDLDAALARDRAHLSGALLNEYIRQITQERAIELKQASDAIASLMDSVKKAKDGGAPPSTEWEENFSTLAGLTKPSPKKAPTDAPGPPPLIPDAPSREEVRKMADKYLDATLDAVAQKSDTIKEVVNSLRRGEIGPLMALERYLASDASATLVRPDSPKYQIRDLQRMLSENGFATELDGAFGPDTKSKIAAYQQKMKSAGLEGLRTDGYMDQATWKVLREDSPDVNSELELIRDFIDDLETKNNYQCARYDGLFEGTEVGMTLFYTDLLMKVWSFEYNGAIPQVAGFVPETKFEVSPVYWEEIKNHPGTRSWLGGRVSSIALNGDRDEVRFAPIATRVYDASSSPFLAGKEVAANFSSARFSSWWNAHYADIAGYEPQYYRLNQILKWTAVAQVLEGAEQPIIANLAQVLVDHSKRFNTWWPARKDLRVQASVPFLTVPGEKTECIAILESKLFPAMNGLESFSGGVTGYMKSDMDTAATAGPKLNSTPETLRSAALDTDSPKFDPGRGHLPVRNLGDFELRPGTVSFLPDSGRLVGNKSSVTADRLDMAYSGSTDRLSIGTAATGTQLYSFSASSSAQEIELSAETGPFLRVVENLSTAGETSGGASSPMESWDVAKAGKDTILLRAPGADWVTVSAVKPDKAGNGHFAVNLGVGDAALSVAPVKATDLAGIESTNFWQLLDGSDKSGTAQGRRFLDSVPGPARDFRLTVDGKSWDAKAVSSSILVRQGGSGLPGPPGAGAAPELSSDDLNMLFALVAGDNRKAAGMKTSKGTLMLASFGGEADPESSALVSRILAATSSPDSAVIVTAEPGATVHFNEDGVLEVPAGLPSSEELGIGALKMGESGPELRSAMSEMIGGITSEDLASLKGALKPEIEAWVALRGINNDDIESLAAADLRISPGYRRAAYRNGAKIGFIEVKNPERLAAAHDYAEKLMKDSASPDTLAQAIPMLRPIYDHVRAIADASGSNTIVTMESASYDIGTIVKLFDNDLHIKRDIPNLQSSVRRAGTPLAADIEHSLFLSTVPLDSPEVRANPSLSRILSSFDSLLISFDAPTTWEDFRDDMEDSDANQITLVIRKSNDGLVFSDRLVSFDLLRAYLEESSLVPKKLIHLITNGGTEVLNLFANSGAFERVILSHFDEGRIDTLSTALENVILYHQHWMNPQIFLTRKEFDEWSAASPDLASALSSVAQPSGDGVQMDAQRLVAAIRTAHPDEAEDLIERELPRIQSHMVKEHDADVDAAIAATAATRIGPRNSFAARKASVELRAVPIVKQD